MFQNTPQAKIFQEWENHLKKKSKSEYRKILTFDEEMAASATEFYSLLSPELQNHMSLEKMIEVAVEHRKKVMKKSGSQKKTFGRVIKKGSSDFSDVDLSEFGL